MSLSWRSPLALLAVAGVVMAGLALAVPGFGDELRLSTTRADMAYYELSVDRPESPCVVALNRRTATVPVTVVNHHRAERVALTVTSQADGRRGRVAVTVPDGRAVTTPVKVPVRPRGTTAVRITLAGTSQSLTLACSARRAGP